MIIDLGPLAGTEGGKLMFQGNQKELEKENVSLTARYLTGKEEIATPSTRRSWKKSINLTGAAENNLKSIDQKNTPYYKSCTIESICMQGFT